MGPAQITVMVTNCLELFDKDCRKMGELPLLVTDPSVFAKYAISAANNFRCG
jgi:hypothetical protein